MSKNTKILLIVVAVILAVGLAIYFRSERKSTVPSEALCGPGLEYQTDKPAFCK
jgi:flagellar basal body-associated protein FliL